MTAEQRAEEQHAERGSEDPERQHPQPHLLFLFAVKLRGEFQGRVNRWGKCATALAARQSQW
jgi:hypothetical protein